MTLKRDAKRTGAWRFSSSNKAKRKMQNIIIRLSETVRKSASVMTAALCITSSANITAQNYSKLYDALPDMTLDQSYSALLEYQKSNPYFSNTYIQIGSVCEKKMILYDPLRETSTIQFWAKNANLFYGNLKVYYTANDVRSEYYENIGIPFSGNRVTDEDLWSYVEKHKAMCKNYSDSVSIIFSAIERSRQNYNKCIDEFTSICKEYSNLNDLLLRNDDELANRLSSLKSKINECETQFAEYKRLTKLFPIANYRQLYEKKPIETYRLDGLTNSDFFENRFTIWDYASWVDNVEKEMSEHIKPLRKEVEAINNAYAAARAQFDRGDLMVNGSPKPFGEFFFYKVGHYDVGTLIEPLFNYLELTREMTNEAGDSLGRDTGTDMTLESRKMRRLSQLTVKQAKASQMRSLLASAISNEKVSRFKDFFSKEYGGSDGLKAFLVKDEAYCQSIIDAMAEATATYIDRVARQNSTEAEIYSKASGATAPALPLWVSLEPQSVKAKYVSTHVARSARGTVTAVSGYAKANARNWFVAGISDEQSTLWFSQLKNINSVSGIKATDDGVLVSAIRELKPVIIYVNSLGKEAFSVPTTSEIVDVMDRDGVTGSIVWTEGNDKQSPVISMAQETSTQAEWTVPINGIAKTVIINTVGDGYVVTGISNDGALACVRVSYTGEVGNIENIYADVEDIKSSIRVSSNEIGVLAKLKNGANKYISFSLQ